MAGRARTRAGRAQANGGLRMAGLVLSREEIREITGCAQRAPQRQHLDALGIPYRVNAEGWPVVDRRAYYQAMAGEAADASRHEQFIMDLERING